MICVDEGWNFLSVLTEKYCPVFIEQRHVTVKKKQITLFSKFPSISLHIFHIKFIFWSQEVICSHKLTVTNNTAIA